MALTVSEAGESPDGLSGWATAPGFAAIDAHPYWGGFGRAYYPAANVDSRRDASFAVLADGRPALVAPCSIGAGRLDWHGFPLRLFLRDGLAPDLAQGVLERALDHVEARARAAGVAAAIEDLTSAGVLSPLGEKCLARGAAAAVALGSVVELGAGEPGMRRGLRKSFKSLLNWGRQNLETQIVGAANPDRALFDRYQAFHRAVAGRTTRPQESWDIMFRWIAGGRGELVASFLEGALIGGTMVVDGDRTAAYASGVYDRARFDKPVAHWPLWLAMLRSAERGMTAFDVGALPQAGSDKERTIAYFKRGFATSIAVSIVWTWPHAAP